MKEDSISSIEAVAQNLQVVNNHSFMTPHFLEIYKKALQTSKLDPEDNLRWRNVAIYENDHLHEVYTVGNDKLPHLVLLHGYGGTSLTYIKMVQHLKDHFQIHALDTFGVGLSSRGKWKAQLTTQQTINYFIDPIEQWRKRVGISDFILAGHSFGGYLATLYYEKYQKRVRQLILLSPAGTAKFTDQQIKERASKSKIFFCIASKIWNMKIRPSKTVNSCCFGNKIINFLLEKRLKIPEEQRGCWKDYLQYIGSQEECSQTGFYILFQWPLQPVRSIEMIMLDIKPKIPILFLYGDQDWMQPAGAYRLAKQLSQIKVQIVKSAGHQMLFDNPSEVSRKVIMAYSDLE